MGYGIRAADGVVGYSDLRQHGWTFATDDAEEEAAEAPVLKMPSMNTTDRAEWNEAARLALSVYHDTGAYDPNLWNVYDGTGRICATRRTEAEAQAAKDELYKERLASYTARQN
jgi:hypothetical protein